MSSSLWLHGLQHVRLFCSPLSTRICSISGTLNLWWYLIISSSSVPFSFSLQSFPASESSNELALPIKWPKYWSFSFNIDTFNDYLGWFSIGWTRLISQEFSAAPQFKSISSLALSFLYQQTLTSAHDYRKKHKFDYVDLCQKNDVSAF